MQVIVRANIYLWCGIFPRFVREGPLGLQWGSLMGLLKGLFWGLRCLNSSKGMGQDGPVDTFDCLL